MFNKINAFEMWCYRRMLKLSWKDRITSGETHLYILEGKMYGNKPRGRPRRIWMDDITEWTGLKTYGEAKRIAEDRERWKSMVVNLLLEDDK